VGLDTNSFRISGLGNLMKCKGRPSLISPEFPPHPAAAEGTAAGEYVRHLIEKTTPGTHASNGIEFDDDMKFHANECLPYFSPTAKCEHELRWQTRSGIVLIGHPDASDVVGTDLIIEDYKYGWNIVDAKEEQLDGSYTPNWQLLGYAVCEMKAKNPAVTHVTLKIIQPRPHHEEGIVRSFRITVQQLWNYAEQVETVMMDIKNGSKELRTGSQCKYCPHASGSCPAFKRAFYSAFDYIMYHHQKDDINNNELAQHLDMVARAEKIIDTMTGSLNQLAVHRVQSGAIIPGYVSEKTYGNRKWKKNVSPEVIAAMTKGIKIVKTEMVTPAQAIKLGVPKEITEFYTERFFVGEKIIKKDASKVGAEIFKNKLTGGM